MSQGSLGDMQCSPSDLQDGSGSSSSSGSSGSSGVPTLVAYTPPAYTGKITVTVDWAPANAAPVLSGFALPQSAWLKADALTESGGVLDPAGVPLQVALSASMHPVGSALIWITVLFDPETRLGEVEIPAGTAPGCYYLCWRSLLTENAPSTSGGIIESAVLTID